MTARNVVKTTEPLESGEGDGVPYPEKSRSLDCLREMRLVARAEAPYRTVVCVRSWAAATWALARTVGRNRWRVCLGLRTDSPHRAWQITGRLWRHTRVQESGFGGRDVSESRAS